MPKLKNKLANWQCKLEIINNYFRENKLVHPYADFYKTAGRAVRIDSIKKFTTSPQAVGKFKMVKEYE